MAARRGRRPRAAGPTAAGGTAAPRLPGRARRLPRRRRLRLGPGGAARGRRAAARRRWPAPGPGGRLRRRAVRALAGRPGRRSVALDLSAGQLATPGGSTPAARVPAVPLVQADAAWLPFADATFDLACSAYGALPFVADSAAVMREVARVLRPGGRWVFSVTHPMRWAFPDDPGPGGLTATCLLRPHAVRRGRRPGLARLRRAPPHPRRPGPRDRRRRTAAGRPGRAGVARGWNDQEWGGWRPLRGRAAARHRDLQLPSPLRQDCAVAQWFGNGYVVDDDPARVDRDLVYGWLSTDAYWWSGGLDRVGLRAGHRQQPELHRSSTDRARSWASRGW